MKILMTGSTGYVGSHLLPQLLEEGHEVMIIIRSKQNKYLVPGVRLFEITEDQQKLCQQLRDFKPEICLHLASHLTAADDFSTMNVLLAANIEFTCRILDALKQVPLKLFINTGTFAEYCGGNEKLDPAYLYAATKTAARSIIRYYASSYHFRVATIVPYTIYGGRVRQKKIIDLVFDSLGSSKSIALTPGEQMLDFIHIEDVVDFYALLISKYEDLADNVVFNLGTGHGHTLRQLAEMMEAISGQQANICWGGRPYRERDTFYSVANISLQYRIWKWKPKIDLQTGLFKYLNERAYVTQ